MDELFAKLGLAAPWILAAAAGIGIFFDRVRGTTESGGNLITTALQTGRRVQATQRDNEIVALKAQLEGVVKVVNTLQIQVERHQETIDGLRFDLTEMRSYSWDAYSEIRRIDPDSTFPKPPKYSPGRFTRIPIDDTHLNSSPEHHKRPSKKTDTPNHTTED